MIPSNACPLCLTAAAGTELAGASSEGTVNGTRYSRAPPSFPLTGVYNPKAFVPHAASLRQAFAHCGKFPTAASRRSRDRVSVPVWLVVLSDQLPVIALVGRYPANKLIGREPLQERQLSPPFLSKPCGPKNVSSISLPFERVSRTQGQVAHVLLTRTPLEAPLYCYRSAPRSTCMC